VQTARETAQDVGEAGPIPPCEIPAERVVTGTSGFQIAFQITVEIFVRTKCVEIQLATAFQFFSKRNVVLPPQNL
jgi:hypothetical protein